MAVLDLSVAKEVEGEKQTMNPYANSAAVADDADYAKRENSRCPRRETKMSSGTSTISNGTMR